jgi:hypothetical protein
MDAIRFHKPVGTGARVCLVRAFGSYGLDAAHRKKAQIIKKSAPLIIKICRAR